MLEIVAGELVVAHGEVSFFWVYHHWLFTQSQLGQKVILIGVSILNKGTHLRNLLFRNASHRNVSICPI